MRGVMAALPLSIVGVLALSSVAWACGDFDRPGEMCGRDQRGPSGSKWEQRERGEPGRFPREGMDRGRFEHEQGERDRFEREKIRQEAQDEANAIIEEGMMKADAKMQEAIALKRNAETLQEYLSTKIAEEKNLTDAAIKREHEAADKIKEAEDSKKRYDLQIKLIEEQRDRYEKRFTEILAHDPCGQTPTAPAAGGAGTH